MTKGAFRIQDEVEAGSRGVSWQTIEVAVCHCPDNARDVT